MDTAAMWGTSLRSHSPHRLALAGTSVGRVVGSSGRAVAVMQCRNRSRAHWSLFSHSVCSPSQPSDAQHVYLSLRQLRWLGFVSCLFYGIVMLKCIFLMSCVAKERIPAEFRRCLRFFTCIGFGTNSYNDFLATLCFKIKGFQYSAKEI